MGGFVLLVNPLRRKLNSVANHGKRGVKEAVGKHHSGKGPELTGQRSGSLTVLCPAENPYRLVPLV